jgi:hypothetical protein
MAETTLIANTGIQTIRFSAEINNEKLRSKKFTYFEDVDLNRRRFWLEELILLPEFDLFVRKNELKVNGGLGKDGKPLKEFEPSGIKTYYDGQPQVYEAGNINQVIKHFEHRWIPVPYFKNNSINQDYFGPTDWTPVFRTLKNKQRVRC